MIPLILFQILKILFDSKENLLLTMPMFCLLCLIID